MNTDRVLDAIRAHDDALRAGLDAAAARDALARELDSERHDFVGGPFYGCEVCTELSTHQYHRTSAVILAEINGLDTPAAETGWRPCDACPHPTGCDGTCRALLT